MITRIFAAIAALLSLHAIFAAEPGQKSGIEQEHFQPGIRPQDDLFRRVNGKWLLESKIPSDRPADGAFHQLRDRSEKQVRAIIEDAAKTKNHADSQKIANFFASFMDEERAEQ